MSYNGLLINTCDLLNYVYVAKYQPKTEVATPNVRCRVMYQTKLVRDSKGNEVVSAAKIFFLKNQALDHATKVTNIRDSGGTIIDSSKYSIINILGPQNSIQRHHKEVYVN